VDFEGALAGVEPQIILTDFLVDHIYPVTPREGTEIAARSKDEVVATYRKLENGGIAAFLGYRPRDDQSASLGYETRNCFDVLSKLGAYPAIGKFDGVNDNTEHISRTTGYLTCRFPNGAVAIAPHLKTVEEDWDSGFARDQEKDKEYLDNNPPPSDAIKLEAVRINGHDVTYSGTHAMAFRVNERGHLAAFAGSGCTGIIIDGREWKFADHVLWGIAWAPIAKERHVPGGAVVQIMVRTPGEVRIPLADVPGDLELVVEGSKPGSRGETVPSRVEDGALVLEVTDAVKNRWVYGIARS
jgi:hypothetical protein